MAKEHTVNLQCSFCGKTQREVKKLIAGPAVYICDECIGLCNDIIAEEVDRHIESLGEVRSVILARLERHDLTLTRLVEGIRRNGDMLPAAVMEAITELDLAWTRFRGVVAASLPPPPGPTSSMNR